MKLSFKDGFMAGLGFIAAQIVSGLLSVLLIIIMLTVVSIVVSG